MNIPASQVCQLSFSVVIIIIIVIIVIIIIVVIIVVIIIIVIIIIVVVIVVIIIIVVIVILIIVVIVIINTIITIIAIIIIIIAAIIIIIISIIIIIIILSPLPLWLRRLRGCRRSSGPQSQLRIRAQGTSRHPPPRWLDSWGPVGCWGCRLLQVELPFIIGTIYIVDCWVIVVKVQIVADYYCYTSLSISCLIPSGKLT